MKPLCFFLLALLASVSLVLAGCSNKNENLGAPTPAPMKMNGQTVPSEGAHYMQQMKQNGGQSGANGSC